MAKGTQKEFEENIFEFFKTYGDIVMTPDKKGAMEFLEKATDIREVLYFLISDMGTRKEAWEKLQTFEPASEILRFVVDNMKLPYNNPESKAVFKEIKGKLKSMNEG